ncbi:MAG: glucose-6-phosphate isomerase [Bacteroidetes bacterium HGW-Bacteroidetes-5]|jgi:glucose-6-phosphate isomerase|nr:MAG: glucose-6-phosphate isomerase [Bacteroidetes bacterium HGW-Bacteroidetes-5]
MKEIVNRVNVDIKGVTPFIDESELKSYNKAAQDAYKTLVEGSGRGNDFLGWVDLPSNILPTHIELINDIAREWRGLDVVVVIGIGGSYLGSKAALEALSHHFSLHLGKMEWPKIVFAGQNLSEEYMSELMDLLTESDFATIVISKSGTTTEPAVAFRIIKNLMERKYSKAGTAGRIVAVTDSSKGALKKLADEQGYRTFIIPDDIGGRYSVLTPVGLLPIAAAGFDIEKMVLGAADMQRICISPSEDNPALKYAAVRNLLYSKGKKIEILVNFNPKLQYFSEWWKQLFGESEGKEGRGIFPASVNFTSDLHSMGQYVQDGERTLFETVITVGSSNRSLSIVNDPDNLDGLNFLSGKSIDECNKMAELGTMLAHIDGGVPNIRIEIPAINEYYIGALFYFFEFACGVSAYILGINPFDQPGVEDYKKNMFALLGKPGFEELSKSLRDRL